MKADPKTSFLVGALGFGMLQVVGMYNSTAPSLGDLRSVDANDAKQYEALMDADVIVGTTTLLLTILACYATESLWPIPLLLGGLALDMFWHHLVLATPSTNGR